MSLVLITFLAVYNSAVFTTWYTVNKIKFSRKERLLIAKKSNRKHK